MKFSSSTAAFAASIPMVNAAAGSCTNPATCVSLQLQDALRLIHSADTSAVPNSVRSSLPRRFGARSSTLPCHSTMGSWAHTGQRALRWHLHASPSLLLPKTSLPSSRSFPTTTASLAFEEVAMAHSRDRTVYVMA